MIKFIDKFASISSNKLLIFTTIFFTAFTNASFYENILEVYPINTHNFLFIVSLVVVFSAALTLLLSVVCFRYSIKPILIMLLIISSFTAYFMDSYNTIVDENMVQNILNTDFKESLDLFSFKLVGYVVFLGLIPAFFIYRVPLKFLSFWRELLSRLKLMALMLVVIFISIAIFSDFYSSFLREHKQLRYYSNPGFYIFSTASYLSGFVKSTEHDWVEIAKDAKKDPTNTQKKLVIFVVGETARADRFSLNGYKRETNPALSKENIVSFGNFWSCGTTTSVSVPCMFSSIGEANYDKETIKNTENALDILQRVGDKVLWLDNNSNSKGVADRVPYQSFRNRKINPLCDTECRDEGMLVNLQKYIDNNKQSDIFIVLHQLGNHGPAYYKRYPVKFKKYTPVCETNQLEKCSKEELNNAYDNAILYTDYFLAKVIALLKNNNDFQTAMLYVSDHGESLGENRLYLHGLPNFLAPKVQKHVAVVFWAGENNKKYRVNQIQKSKDLKFTHDNVFPAILGLMGVKTAVYNESADFLKTSKKYRVETKTN